MSRSSGSRRRRLPDIPSLQTVSRHRRGITAEQNGDGFVDVRVDLKSSSSVNGKCNDLQSRSVGSELQSMASRVIADDGEKPSGKEKRVHNPGYCGSVTSTLADRTDQKFSVENDPSLVHVEELANGGSRRRKCSSGKHDCETSSIRRCQSLFALMRSCRFISMTLEIPQGIPGDDVICGVNEGVIRLTETDVAGAAALNTDGRWRLHGLRSGGDTATQSAFRPVGQATITRSPAEKSTDNNVDSDGLLVVVSEVLRDVTLPRSQHQLLPSDILLEVHYYNSCDISQLTLPSPRQ